MTELLLHSVAQRGHLREGAIILGRRDGHEALEGQPQITAQGLDQRGQLGLGAAAQLGGLVPEVHLDPDGTDDLQVLRQAPQALDQFGPVQALKFGEVLQGGLGLVALEGTQQHKAQLRRGGGLVGAFLHVVLAEAGEAKGGSLTDEGCGLLL